MNASATSAENWTQGGLPCGIIVARLDIRKGMRPLALPREENATGACAPCASAPFHETVHLD